MIDWTRTDLEYEWGDGSRALAFDIDDFAAFELHILKRPGAAQAYDAAAQARVRSFLFSFFLCPMSSVLCPLPSPLSSTDD